MTRAELWSSLKLDSRVDRFTPGLKVSMSRYGGGSRKETRRIKILPVATCTSQQLDEQPLARTLFAICTYINSSEPGTRATRLTSENSSGNINSVRFSIIDSAEEISVKIEETFLTSNRCTIFYSDYRSG